MTAPATQTHTPPTTTARSVWRKPFSSDTWRRTLYLLAVGPVSVLALVGAVVGWPAIGPALHGRLAETLRVIPRGSAVDRPSISRVIGHAVLGIPLGAATMIATAYGWALVVLNVGYPIRGAAEATDAWGGPSLAGAWAVHAAAGLVFLFVVPWIVDGLTAVHRRLLRLAGIARMS
jgi:hypothetical protein